MSSGKRPMTIGASSASKRGKTAGSGGSSSAALLPGSSPDWWNARRARYLTQKKGLLPSTSEGCIVYWMSRDQRAEDNWACLYARHLAYEAGVPLRVVFNLMPRFLEATIRHFGFMLRGLQEVEAAFRAKGIPFHLLSGDPVENVPAFAAEHGALAVVCDMSPLRVPASWSRAVAARLDAGSPARPLIQVDAHNIVPVWEASDKQEYAARTIRPKIHALLADFFTDIPPLPPADASPSEEGTNGGAGSSGDSESSGGGGTSGGGGGGGTSGGGGGGFVVLPDPVDWEAAEQSLEVDRTVTEVTWLTPGAAAGKVTLDCFIADRLDAFADSRNNPNVEACSGLSPYLHFGQVGAQRAALEVKRRGARRASESIASFIEEAVVRRELADNFCFYNDKYDRIDGAAGWAQDSLQQHAADPRERLYSEANLEAGRTHDDLWNAAQLQMVQEGKMHGFMRMYWAKKILEWTASPAEALRIANRLNDRYELDGRDPNGYTGVAWSIMGIHDMGWAERAIFGKIRYMNYAGCSRKFDIANYVARYKPAAQNCIVAGGTIARPKKTSNKAKAAAAKPTAKPSAKRTTGSSSGGGGNGGGASSGGGSAAGGGSGKA